jgi:hypothetical protein
VFGPRARFYVKLFAALSAVVFVAGIFWFSLRAEKYILAALPEEITVQNLSVSFLNQAFVMTGVVVQGKAGSSCGGKTMFTIRELTGSFSLRYRKLSALRFVKPEYKDSPGLRDCITQPAKKPALRFSDHVHPSGLAVRVEEGLLSLPGFDDMEIHADFILAERGPNRLALSGNRLSIRNSIAEFDLKKLALEIQGGAGGDPVAESGHIMARLRVIRPEKISQLRTRQFTVLGGEGDIQMAADANHGFVTAYTSVDLKQMRLTGQTLYNMPMGLLTLTPENLWPMVEDSPGHLKFSFKTRSEQAQFVRSYVADFRKALVDKIKANLKKKIPVLPF